MTKDTKEAEGNEPANDPALTTMDHGVWPALSHAFTVKLLARLQTRGIPFDEQRVKAIVSAYFPDVRAISTLTKDYADPQKEWPDFLPPLE